MAREGASGDTSLAPVVLPALVRSWDISPQPWGDVLEEGHLEGELGLALLPPGMRMERGSHLPDPFRVPRPALCDYLSPH